MIGRGAIRNPWIFDQIRSRLRGDAIFELEWWQPWEPADGKFPPFTYVVASVDSAFTEKEQIDLSRHGDELVVATPAPAGVAIFEAFDQIGRAGALGEEFALALPGCDVEDAIATVEATGYTAEEQAYALRLYTHGWDIFHMSGLPLYHLYNNAESGAPPRPLHWDEQFARASKYGGIVAVVISMAWRVLGRTLHA